MRDENEPNGPERISSFVAENFSGHLASFSEKNFRGAGEHQRFCGGQSVFMYTCPCRYFRCGDSSAVDVERNGAGKFHHLDGQSTESYCGEYSGCSHTSKRVGSKDTFITRLGTYMSLPWNCRSSEEDGEFHHHLPWEM